MSLQRSNCICDWNFNFKEFINKISQHTNGHLVVQAFQVTEVQAKEVTIHIT